MPMIEDFNSAESQKNKLKEFLHKTIDSEYIYIDVPLYLNIGDWLIALGAWELLNELPFRCLGRWRWDDVEPQNISSNTIILLQGGGNYGDLYRGATEARNKIISMFPQNKIIILPQTITYLNYNLLVKDARLYAKHNNLYICARDNVSYQVLLKYFRNNKLYLLPDMALGLYGVLPQQVKTEVKNILIVNRKDKEAAMLFVGLGDVKDWNDILYDIKFDLVWIPYRLLHKIKRLFNSTLLRKAENMYMLNILYPFIKTYVPKYFLRYHLVKTTRLHGYLLALIMHIPVDVLDNRYQKIFNYINTWK